jgi:tetratricopeptide (TPR) repeat protein
VSRALRLSLFVVAVVVAIVVVRSAGFDRMLGEQRAERMYAARSWHDAADAFRALLQDATTARAAGAVPALSFDLATADYRLGRFQQAVQTFHPALAGDRALQERAYYNLGNAYVWQARADFDHMGKRMALRGAISSYEEALLLDPTDKDARWNLEVALRRLADASEPGGQSRHRDAADWGGGNLTKSGYAGAPQTGAGASPGGGLGSGAGGEAVPEVTETQARKLLDAVEKAQVSWQETSGPTRKGSRSQAREPDW